MVPPRCHKSAEASEAILDALVAGGVMYLQEVARHVSFLQNATRELQACSGELRAFGRVGSLDLEPADLPGLPPKQEIWDAFFTPELRSDTLAVMFLINKVEDIYEREAAPLLEPERPR